MAVRGMEEPEPSSLLDLHLRGSSSPENWRQNIPVSSGVLRINSLVLAGSSNARLNSQLMIIEVIHSMQSNTQSFIQHDLLFLAQP